MDLNKNNHNGHQGLHEEHNEYSLCEHCAFFVVIVVNFFYSPRHKFSFPLEETLINFYWIPLFIPLNNSIFS